MSSNAQALRAHFEEQISQMPVENAAAFFERLLRKLDRLTDLDAKDRWLAYLGLRAMYGEAKLSRFDRDILMLQRTWKMLEPLLQENGLLLEYRLDAELQNIISRFLNNQPPETGPKTRRSANRRRQHRLRAPMATSGPATEPQGHLF